MRKKKTYPRFFDPSEIIQDREKSNHGTTIYIRCLDCDGPAWFDVAKRYGQCYICSKVQKLHKQYKAWIDEDIFDAFGIDASVYRRQVNQEPETIEPYPLSQQARDYIRSRGISQQTLLHFPVFQEVRHWKITWLCWQNVSGSYELREIFGSQRGMPSGSTKTYSRFELRPGRRFVVGEGIFDTLSYAQLNGYDADTYIVLNSTNCSNLLISDMTTWDVERVTLALDADRAGMEAIRKLYRAFSPIIAVTVNHPPKVGKDWNDILMEEM